MDKIDMEKAVPFSLEAFKKGNRRVVTRKGNSVRIVCTDRVGKSHTIVALIRIHGREDVLMYTDQGIYNHNGQECTRDLVMLPERVTMYYGLCVDEMKSTPLFFEENAPHTWVEKNRANAKNESWLYKSIEQDVE